MTRLAQVSDSTNPTSLSHWKSFAALLLQRSAGLLSCFDQFYSRIRTLSRRHRRALLKKSAATLAGVALLLALGHSPTTMPAAHAATPIEVDEVNCTLVDAILSAEYDASYGGCTAGSGDDIIELQSNVILMTPFGVYYRNDTGLPLVTTAITIEGNDHVIQRNPGVATPPFGILAVGSTGDLTLNDVTISGAYVTSRGGAVFLYEGKVTISNSALNDNKGHQGDTFGAGVNNRKGYLTVNNSTISYNSGAGGIYILEGSATINNSIISNNIYRYAIESFDSEVIISDSIISDNEGGGIITGGGNMTIINSTISNNMRFYQNGNEDGGSGVSTIQSKMIITNTTISNNEHGGVRARGEGDVTLSDSTISGNSVVGVIDDGGNMTIINTTINGNNGSGVATGDYSSVTITNSTINNNSTTKYGNGGGVLNYGTVIITNSAISGNSAYASGGGIQISKGEATVINTTISDNSAGYDGGGVASWGGTTTIANSTISGNEALYNGGGIHNWNGNVIVTTSTITKNLAGQYGGGVFQEENNNATTTFNHSIVSGNSGGEVYARPSSTHIYADNYNLFGHGGIGDAQAFVNFTPGFNDINATSDGENIPLTDILETTLADNGGWQSGAPGLEVPPLTHALVPGSPAIDAAPSTACIAPTLDQDQRGVPRNLDGDGNGNLAGTECDIGAFEYLPEDNDDDGVSSSEEDRAPNNGDGNNDGMPDSQQENVTSLPNSEDGDYVTLESPAGTSLANVKAVSNPSPANTPPGTTFPIGFLDFRVENVTPGSAVAVTIYLPNGQTINDYYKYGPTPDDPTDHWYQFLYDGTTGAEILSDRIVLHFVDGERGDNDLTANGMITDPGAPTLQNEFTTDIFITTSSPGTTNNGITFGKEDILLWNGNTWSLFFDGSTKGLTKKHDINATHVNNPSDLYLSFLQNKANVPGLKSVRSQDILHFDGNNFDLYFDGSDVGLTTASEKIDGLHILDGSVSPIGSGCDAYLLISTLGSGKVPAFGGGTLKFQGEDILGFCATSLGMNTAGHWHMVVDGSNYRMPKNSTDSIVASEDGSVIYLATKSTFNVDRAAGGHSMIYKFESGSFSGPVFSAPANGLNQKVDGLHVEFD